MAYWQDRFQASQRAIANARQKEIDKRIHRYYKNLSRQVIADYEALYNQVLLKEAAGEQISPATLYQMDKYWSMNAQLKKRLTSLGDKLTVLMSKLFEIVYIDSYEAINIKGLEAFSTVDEAAVKQVLNAVWATDGQSWSQRIWQNTQMLQQMLDEQLVHCVATGKKPTQLKNLLQERFDVSYHRADTLVRTEVAHIQTEAAKQRYLDYGIREVQFWADPDERTCPECGKLHGKKYPVGAHVPLPAHPNCRCCIVPVVD